MRFGSIPLGRIFGVELRLHFFSVAALVLLIVTAALAGGSLSRGVLLWAWVMVAVAVRETARSLAWAYAGIPLVRLVLTPTGALAGHGDDVPEARHPQLLALVGPVANFVAALTMTMFVFAVTSRFNLFQRHLMEPTHLLRAAIWAQLAVGGIHLLPASPLDAGVLLRAQLARMRGPVLAAKAAAGLSQGIGLALVLVGAFTQEVVLILLGGTALLSSQAESQTQVAQQRASSLTVGDVMLAEWTSLGASDTLEGALERSTHSLQEVFPVVRGPLVVGAVSRTTLLARFRLEGNGYVQGVMSRNVYTAAPGDGLVETLRRVNAVSGGNATVVPVVLQDRMVGLVTPQNLSQTMIAFGHARRIRDRHTGGNRDA